MTAATADLELELRQLPDVVGVGFTQEDDTLVVHVLVHAATHVVSLRRQVEERCRAHVSIEVRVEVSGGAPRLAERRRVRLRDVTVEAATEEVAVCLVVGNREAAARGPSGTAGGAVTATLRALRALGARVPFRGEASASRLREGPQHAVVVVLQETEGEARLYGVSRGDSVEAAAARATLHALNRYLEADSALG